MTGQPWIAAGNSRPAGGARSSPALPDSTSGPPPTASPSVDGQPASAGIAPFTPPAPPRCPAQGKKGRAWGRLASAPHRPGCRIELDAGIVGPGWGWFRGVSALLPASLATCAGCDEKQSVRASWPGTAASGRLPGWVVGLGCVPGCWGRAGVGSGVSPDCPLRSGSRWRRALVATKSKRPRDLAVASALAGVLSSQRRLVWDAASGRSGGGMPGLGCGVEWGRRARWRSGLGAGSRRSGRRPG